jgi:hypothetical protein
MSHFFEEYCCTTKPKLDHNQILYIDHMMDLEQFM